MELGVIGPALQIAVGVKTFVAGGRCTAGSYTVVRDRSKSPFAIRSGLLADPDHARKIHITFFFAAFKFLFGTHHYHINIVSALVLENPAGKPDEITVIKIVVIHMADQRKVIAGNSFIIDHAIVKAGTGNTLTAVSLQMAGQLVDHAEQPVEAGGVTAEDLEKSKRSMEDFFLSVFDTPEELDGWLLSQVTDDEFQTPEDLVADLKEVTVEQVIEMANNISLDTVFLLKGTGTGGDGEVD